MLSQLPLAAYKKGEKKMAPVQKAHIHLIHKEQNSHLIKAINSLDPSNQLL